MGFAKVGSAQILHKQVQNALVASIAIAVGNLAQVERQWAVPVVSLALSK